MPYLSIRTQTPRSVLHDFQYKIKTYSCIPSLMRDRKMNDSQLQTTWILSKTPPTPLERANCCISAA